MKIVVETENGKIFEIETSENSTVDSLVDMLLEKGGVPSDYRAIFYNGRMLEANRTLLEYNVKEGCLLYLSKPSDNFA